LDNPPRDQGFLLSIRKGVDERRNNNNDFELLNWLIAIGSLLTLVLLLLILMLFASIDPIVRFALLLIGLGVAALILIHRSNSGKEHLPSFEPEGHVEPEEKKNALQVTIENLDLAFEGDPFKQMLAFQELKDLLIDRLALRRHMSRSEALDMASDEIWLEEEIDQRELRLLLTTNLNETYASELSCSTDRRKLISNFQDNYKRILKLVEEM
jgi:hypothetical protein